MEDSLIRKKKSTIWTCCKETLSEAQCPVCGTLRAVAQFRSALYERKIVSAMEPERMDQARANVKKGALALVNAVKELSEKSRTQGKLPKRFRSENKTDYKTEGTTITPAKMPKGMMIGSPAWQAWRSKLKVIEVHGQKIAVLHDPKEKTDQRGRDALPMNERFKDAPVGSAEWHKRQAYLAMLKEPLQQPKLKLEITLFHLDSRSIVLPLGMAYNVYLEGGLALPN